MLPKVLRPQDDVCRLLGDIHCAVHRDADVALAHGQRIVDAVAHIAHGVPVRLERGNNPLFLRRGELGEQAAFPHGLAERLVAHGFHIHPCQAVLGIHADFAAHLDGHAFAVSRQHDNFDAVLLQRRNGLGGALLGRV